MESEKSSTLNYQDGIYYKKNPFNPSYKSIEEQSNNSFALLFLRIVENTKANEVTQYLEKLWKIYDNLKSGHIIDLPGHIVPSGDLSVLIGYSPLIFNLDDITKKIPRDFKDRQFLPAKNGKPILDGSGIPYSNEICENFGLSHHIVIQLISKTQMATNRAIVETKRYLHNETKEKIQFSTFYSGFQRDDGRSWLGFHDEVSNMSDPIERANAVFIDIENNNLLHRDFWTKNGTYLAYLRTEINLDTWSKIEQKRQELIVGREKLDGYPLIGVDKNGNIVTKVKNIDSMQINSYNQDFHDHPDYFKEPKVTDDKLESIIDMNESSRVLNQSHIGRARHMDNIDSKYTTSRRIFRQGFEFLEPLYNKSNTGSNPFRAGLNFVSFQNDPARLFFILTDPNWMGNSNFGGELTHKETNQLFSVLASGVFFIPSDEEPFPGISIFSSL